MPIRQENVSRRDGVEQKISCLIRKISYTPGIRFTDPHYHEYFEFLYGLSGNAQVLIGERIVEMHPGDLIVVNAKEIHDIRCETDDDASYYVIKFLPNILYTPWQSMPEVRHLLPLWQSEISYSPVVTAAELSNSNINTLIEGIIQEWERREVGHELIMQSNIMKIFVWMLRNRYPQTTRLESVPDSLLHLLQSVLEEAPHHLTDWTVKEAASFANISYSYFSRNFKKVYGIPFSAYMESLRLREGERLLMTTNLGVTEIAAAIGFASTSYFIYHFRQYYGLSPRAFRNQIQTGTVKKEIQ